MRKLFTLLFLLSLALLFAVPSMSVMAQSGAGTIGNASRINLRSGPGAAFPSVFVMSAGQQVTLIGRNADATWVQVILIGSNVSGWVNARYIIPTVPIVNLPVTAGSSGSSAVVTANLLNLRNGPGANFEIIGKLGQGQLLDLIGRNADATWVQVSVPGGGQGWTSARYLSTGVFVSSLPVTSPTGINPGFPQPVPGGGQTGVVTAFNLNVRYGPGVWNPAFTRLALGEGVSLIARSGDGSWLLVQLLDGRTGWVNSGFIRTSFPVFNLPVRG